MYWHEFITKLKKEFDATTLPPALFNEVEKVICELTLNSEFQEFYSVANGIGKGWFKILPIYDVRNTKETWDSIQRANNHQTSRFAVDRDFLHEFVVFADIGGRGCAVYCKRDETIWYQEGDELNQTDLSLKDFVVASLKETRDF